MMCESNADECTTFKPASRCAFRAPLCWLASRHCLSIIHLLSSFMYFAAAQMHKTRLYGLLCYYKALPYGQLGLGPVHPSLRALVGVPIQSLDEMIDQLFNFCDQTLPNLTKLLVGGELRLLLCHSLPRASRSVHAWCPRVWVYYLWQCAQAEAQADSCTPDHHNAPTKCS